MTHNLAEGRCAGCGIRLSDGYTVSVPGVVGACHRCQERRRGRLRRGELFSPTGFPGELIDNRTEKGTLVVA